MSAAERLIGRIHEAPGKIVLAVTGGGSCAIAEMLEVPGASRTVLEAVVPYCDRAMIAWLGGRPDQFCSDPTARAMAMAAFLRARRLDDGAESLAGVACTASLATDRPKRGPHRIHVAFQTAAVTAARSLELLKGRRTRPEEERIAAAMVLNAAAEACGLDDLLTLELLDGEQIEESSYTAPGPWRELLLGVRQAVRHGEIPPIASQPAAVFPGAFNPVHSGHLQMKEVAEEILGRPVEFEISILNVDKPPLDYLETSRRTGQFPPEQTIWLTRAATFEKKSEAFPGATFVVGTDTIRRIADPRYYGNDPAACLAAIEWIAARGCRFLVFARAEGQRIVTLEDLDLPEPLRRISTAVPPERFREDISSTDIRSGGKEDGEKKMEGDEKGEASGT